MHKGQARLPRKQLRSYLLDFYAFLVVRGKGVWFYLLHER